MTTSTPAVAGAGPSQTPDSRGWKPPTRWPSWASRGTLGLPVFFVIIIVFFSVSNAAFLTPANATSILRAAAPLAIAAIGATIVLIAGGIDISQGPLMACAAVTSVALIAHGGLPEGMAIVLALLVGLTLGLVNGLASEAFKIPAFIATLAVGFIVRGVLFLYTDSRSIGLPPDQGGFLRWLGGGSVGPIPVAVLFAALLTALFVLVMRFTPWGLHSYGVGSSAEASRIAGVKVGRQRVSVYMVAGLLSAVAGLVIAGRLGSAGAGFAPGAEFDIITAAVLGGTSIYGGRGSVARTILGAIVLATLANGLIVLNVPSFYQSVVVGSVLLIALGLEGWRRRR